MHDTINFSSKQFQDLWNTVSDFMKRRNDGRGRKSSFRPKGVLFMLLLTVLKPGGHWEFLGKRSRSRDRH